MNVTDIPILQLIPQRPPFVLVDRVVSFDHTTTTTEFSVRTDCILVEDGVLSADGLVENVAQTCAVRMGCVNHVHHESIKLGFIGAVRNMSFFRLPCIGEVLTTSIVVREEVFNMTLVDAQVRSGNELLATAEMKIALSEVDAQKEETLKPASRMNT